MKKQAQVKYTQLFINNEFVDSISGRKFPTINPTNGKVIAEISEGDKADVDKAVKAAKRAFDRKSEWRMMNPYIRGELMHKFADFVTRDLEYIALLDTLDTGKTYTNAIDDVQKSIAVFRYYAGWCDKIHGISIPTGPNFITMTRKEPVGVVGQIVPWNYPFLMLIFKWAPALAAGCTIILKPAEQTPLSALYAAALAKEAGFPAGVINVIPGYGPTAGAAIAEHPEIDKVAFTGSTEVGKVVKEASAKSNLKRVSLELGGKSPVVICDDVDVKEAAIIAHDATFNNHGQDCCSGSRIFVHSKIYDEFVKQSKQLALNRKVGDPFDPQTMQGPQIDQDMLYKIMDLIDSGKKEGAILETGGDRKGDVGYFVYPTVFSNVTDNMRIAKEEIFGPVQSILKFDSMDEVIERANRTKYGLASSIITKDINKAMKFASAVEAGNVWINCYRAMTSQTPFGGWKQSGEGREFGEEGLLLYLELKTISIMVTEEN